MKKRILSLLLAAAMLISVVPLSASAAEVVSVEVQDTTSEAYLSYLELDEETRSSMQPPLAIAPPTVDVSGAVAPIDDAVTLPTKYDPRELSDNYLSPVEDQSTTNTCWTFAATENVETLLNKTEGKTTAESYDFSPRHIEFSSSKLEGDFQNYYEYTREADSGGNLTYSAPYFMRGDGPVANEGAMGFVEYESDAINYPTRAQMDADVAATVLDYYIYDSVNLTSKATISASIEVLKGQLKAGVMEYGSVEVGIWGKGFSNQNKECFNSWTGGGEWTYNDNGGFTSTSDSTIKSNIPTSHDVLLVGWDDDYDWSSKGVTDINGTAFEKGAWIVQNSWGDSTGDSGFFYVPYCELSIYSHGSTATAAKSAEDYSYDNRYLGAIKPFETAQHYNGDYDKMYIGNIFPREAGVEEVIAVSVYAEKKMSCEVYVVDGEITLDKTTSGGVPYAEYKLSSPAASETIEGFGYETIELATPVQITSDAFTVVVAYSAYSSGEEYTVPIDKADQHESSDTMKHVLSVDGELWQSVDGASTTYRGAFNVHTKNVSGRTSVSFKNKNEKAVVTVYKPDGAQIPPQANGTYNLAQGETYNYVSAVFGNESEDIKGTLTAAGDKQQIYTYSRKVSFNAGDGTFATPSDAEQTLDASAATATAPTAPTREGYTFEHWSETVNGTAFDFSTEITEDKTLYAVWKSTDPSAPTTYTVTWNVDGTTSTTSQAINTALVLPTEPSKAPSGCTTYTFAGWYTQADGKGDKVDGSTVFTNTNNDTVYYAYFTETENHADTNTDHTCDNSCGKTDMGTHADSASDNDHVCDYGCGAALENCSDASGDNDHKCDICGKADVSEHTYGNASCGAPATCTECNETSGSALEHIDDNKDHTCDRNCGTTNMGTHADSENDGDHKCDYGCGADNLTEHTYDAATCTTPKTCSECGTTDGEALGHADADKNHTCDRNCGEENIGTHEDSANDGDHKCDYGCGVDNMSEHTYADADCDTPKTCTECGATDGNPLGHADEDKNHTCDRNCGEENIGTHEDNDKDHDCDYGCAETIGTHADSANDTDHFCDYGCNEVLEECSDATGDGDHNCDICDETDVTPHTYTEPTCGQPGECTECKETTDSIDHIDENTDHNCDRNCGKVDMGAHEDKDTDHKCDYGCATAIGTHADSDSDNLCDYCGETIGSSTPVNPNPPVVNPPVDDPVDPTEPTVETNTLPDGSSETTVTWADGKTSVTTETPEGDVSIVVTNSEGEEIINVEVPAELGESLIFDDVDEGDWFKESVDTATALGLFAGTSEDKFSPNDKLTRSMLVTVLHRLSGEAQYGVGEGSFGDVKTDSWYEDAVEWATAAGITSGTGNGNFDPNGNITREQLVTMIYRYVVLIGADITDETQGEMPAFSDSDAVSNYAKEAMDWAISEGIIQGRGGEIAPKDNATRAEVATILVRLVNYLTK